jgi:hypothetical protein
MISTTKILGLSILAAAVAGSIASGWGVGLNNERRDSNEYKAALISLYITTTIIGIAIVVVLFTC